MNKLALVLLVALAGAVHADPPPPPPPPPSPPSQTVPPKLLETNRIRGDVNIVPDDATKTEIARSGKTQIIGVIKLCLAATGDITTVTLIKSTGFKAYDDKLVHTIHDTWGYKPYTVDGKPVPVCTALSFIYRQDAAPPPAKP